MPATPPTQMRIPPDLLAEIDAAARAEGVTRTAWVIVAARRRLDDLALLDEARRVPTPEGEAAAVATNPVATEAPSPTGRRDVPTPARPAVATPVATPRAAQRRAEDCRHPLVRRVGRSCLDCNTWL